MATGIPTILAPMGATREMFADGETGLFATTNEEWHQSLTRLLRDAGMRLRMGSRARAVFESTYELARIVPLVANALSPAIRA
jgi:glycosyltransferase involved in cell wall biosynthesis